MIGVVGVPLKGSTFGALQANKDYIYCQLIRRSSILKIWTEKEKQKARNEITDVKARYCRLLDCKQWEAYAETFMPDGVLQYGPNAEISTVNGRAEIIGLLSMMLRKAVTAHRIHPAEFHFLNNGEVRAIWPMDDRVEQPGYIVDGSGYYDDLYCQMEGEWHIKYMHLRRLRVDMKAGPWYSPMSWIMRLVFLMQRTGLLKLLSPKASITMAESEASGINIDLFDIEPGQKS